ncbi:helix-turn-helix domain-containing protein [Rhodoligotrophos ferricapiens]|uniref:helix-turn-helix domain-containing protein n=1 Tax=Rhodoligotrophos ferricapiens TaxID=3069264 RepID=UPI00315DEAE4
MIVVMLDQMLAKRKMRSRELAHRIGITEQNLSLLKSGKVKGVRFETLEKICAVLDCQPGDILGYQAEGVSCSTTTGRLDLDSRSAKG